MIEIEDFKKVEMRAGKIISAEAVEGSNLQGLAPAAFQERCITILPTLLILPIIPLTQSFFLGYDTLMITNPYYMYIL